MSDYDKNFLNKKFKELEEELSEPKIRKPNDHVLLIDGLNTFIRAFSVNPSLNEDGSHVGGLVAQSTLRFNLLLTLRPALYCEYIF